MRACEPMVDLHQLDHPFHPQQHQPQHERGDDPQHGPHGAQHGPPRKQEPYLENEHQGQRDEYDPLQHEHPAGVDLRRDQLRILHQDILFRANIEAARS